MSFNKFTWICLSTVVTLAPFTARGQTVSAGQYQYSPFAVGAGASLFSPDFNSGTMLGVAFWVDYRPQFIARHVEGLSVAMELRDLNYKRSAAQTNLREDTYLGGFRYEWQRYDGVRPYGRALVGYGNIEFPPTGTYHHDNRITTAFSGGADFRINGDVWLRADYEYQIWPNLFGTGIHPQGVTVGVMYNFRSRRNGF